MNTWERVRTHHVENFNYVRTVEHAHYIYRTWPVKYKIGTGEERKLFLDTFLRIRKAVVGGRYQDIGEVPDGLCDVCLDPNCSDSKVTRFFAPDELAFRRYIGELVAEEVYDQQFMSIRDLHRVACKKVDLLLKSRCCASDQIKELSP